MKNIYKKLLLLPIFLAVYLYSHCMNSNNDNTSSSQGDLNKQLLAAVNNPKTNKAEIARLLSQGADVNYMGTSGLHGPLYFAANRGDIEIVRLLLQYGANVNQAESPLARPTALNIAFHRGNKEIILLLLQYGGCDTSIVYPGSNNKAMDGLKSLITDNLSRACMLGNTQEVRQLLASPNLAIPERTFTPLHWAVAQGNGKVVQLLLEDQRFNINAQDEEGNTPLHIAIRNGQVIAQVLLSHNAQVNALNNQDQTPLHFAAQYGRTALAQLLLYNHQAHIGQMDNIDGDTALILAIFYGHTDVIKLLLTHGANANYIAHNENTPLIVALWRGNTEIIQLLLNYGAQAHYKRESDGWTALHEAAAAGNTEVIKLLLDNGAFIDETTNIGDTALIEAAYNGHAQAVELLSQRNANIAHANRWGNTALILAAQEGYVNIIKILLARGANVNEANSVGNTALIWAAIGGDKSIVELLLAHGALINHANRYGNTALIWAAARGHREVIELLIAHGANRNHVTNDGNTAVTIALDQRHYKIATFLLRYGVRVPPGREKHVSNFPATCNPPLTRAAVIGNLNLVRELLPSLAPADVNVRDDLGMTALHWAAAQGHVEIVQELLAHGATMYAHDNEGYTPGGLADRNQHYEIAQLFQHGAERRFENISRTGITLPLELEVLIAAFLISRHKPV